MHYGNKITAFSDTWKHALECCYYLGHALLFFFSDWNMRCLWAEIRFQFNPILCCVKHGIQQHTTHACSWVQTAPFVHYPYNLSASTDFLAPGHFRYSSFHCSYNVASNSAIQKSPPTAWTHLSKLKALKTVLFSRYFCFYNIPHIIYNSWGMPIYKVYRLLEIHIHTSYQ